MIILLIGGVRAGKSARALSLASAHRDAGALLFVATAQAFDDEMRARIDAHQRERLCEWTTLESPIEVAADLDRRAAESPAFGAIVIDCLTLWVSNILLTLAETDDAETIIADHTRHLLTSVERLSAAGTHVIIVTNEVGLGIVPATALGRRYRDALGRVNQLVASATDEVVLLVAGLPLPLKTRR
jgi:adenosylcobinamide kinase / adenosylcobinamide-phosphate guanylyltransferase